MYVICNKLTEEAKGPRRTEREYANHRWLSLSKWLNDAQLVDDLNYTDDLDNNNTMFEHFHILYRLTVTHLFQVEIYQRGEVQPILQTVCCKSAASFITKIMQLFWQ